MFETTEIRGRVDTLRRFVTFLVSIGVHVAGIVVLVIMPLMFLNVLPAEDLLTFLIEPPPLPQPLPPPTPPIKDRIEVFEQVTVVESGFVEPSGIPHGVPVIQDEPVDVTYLGTAMQGVNSRIFSGAVTGTGALTALNPLPVPALPPPPPPVIVRTPTRLGGVVLESKVVHRVQPEYPPLARTARVSGVVILDVTVNDEGEVSEIRVLSGHPLLQQAALDAVRQWKYSPTLLNGEPVPVQGTVTVIFNLR
jgi:protein TonB